MPLHRLTFPHYEIEGDPLLAEIIKILRDAREEGEFEDLEHHIEAARSIA